VDSYLTYLYISEAIIKKKPFIASRLGFTEAWCLSDENSTKNPSERIMRKIWKYSGVFPDISEHFKLFAERYISALGSVDLLALIKTEHETRLIKRTGISPLKCELRDLEPFLHPHPWSMHLENLKVAVISPFSESIRNSYMESRSKLFFDQRVLPYFDLNVIKAPQTISFNNDGYISWEAAYQATVKKLDAIEYDVVILGCGAYALPLAAHIKSRGKVAIHLGGIAQVLFGVHGKRWEAGPMKEIFINDFWRVPLESERPKGWEKIENGCYW